MLSTAAFDFLALNGITILWTSFSIQLFSEYENRGTYVKIVANTGKHISVLLCSELVHSIYVGAVLMKWDVMGCFVV